VAQPQVDLEPFGRTLLIDGLIQSCQCDEFVYHESLVHPALLAHPNPRSVFIGGGGEGSTAREVRKGVEGRREVRKGFEGRRQVRKGVEGRVGGGMGQESGGDCPPPTREWCGRS
jgi:hypothetical protein